MFEFNQSVYYGDWGFPVLSLVTQKCLQTDWSRGVQYMSY